MHIRTGRSVYLVGTMWSKNSFTNSTISAPLGVAGFRQNTCMQKEEGEEIREEEREEEREKTSFQAEHGSMSCA